MLWCRATNQAIALRLQAHRQVQRVSRTVPFSILETLSATPYASRGVAARIQAERTVTVHRKSAENCVRKHVIVDQLRACAEFTRDQPAPKLQTL
jgi:hypothetical protein